VAVCFEEVEDFAMQLFAGVCPALYTAKHSDAVTGAGEIKFFYAMDAEFFDLIMYLIEEG